MGNVEKGRKFRLEERLSLFLPSSRVYPFPIVYHLASLLYLDRLNGRLSSLHPDKEVRTAESQDMNLPLILPPSPPPMHFPCLSTPLSSFNYFSFSFLLFQFLFLFIALHFFDSSPCNSLGLYFVEALSCGASRFPSSFSFS